MLDIIIWIVGILIVLPCAFCVELRRCCCKGSEDPDHAKKLSDVGVSDAERGQSAAGAPAGRPRWQIVSAKVLCAVVGGYVFAIVLLAIYVVSLENSLLFTPMSSNDCVAGCTEESCCDYTTDLVTYEDVQFQSGGAILDGWYMESNTSTSATPLIPVLYSHGSGANVAVRYRAQRYKFLLTLGVKLFVYDYPGYGKSTGTPSEASIYQASLDAHAYLLGKTGANASEAVVLGRSLGGAVTVNLASQVASKGMVLQSTFTSFAEAGGVGLPVLGWLVTALISQRFEVGDKIVSYSDCLYQSHSAADEWVTLAQGKALYDSATSKDAACSRFVELTTPLHDDPLTDTEKTQLTEFFNVLRQP